MIKTTVGCSASVFQEQFKKLPGILVPWYRENARDLPFRKDTEPYHVWVSEIMLQQTRVQAAMKHYIHFLNELPTIFDLADVSEEKLLKLWEGLGYYSRAKNLQKAAKKVVMEHNGIFPKDLCDISALPGIGSYTAGAIASICFELPVPAVDGNVIRVASRLTEDPRAGNDVQFKKDIYKNLAKIYPPGSCGDFTQALMELGAMVCTPQSPTCSSCPLGEICLAKKHGTTSHFPVKVPKKAKKKEKKTVFIFVCEGEVALHKRDSEGVLKNMWEFPNVEGTIKEDGVLDLCEHMGLSGVRIFEQTRATHIFTHIVWEMTCYGVLCEKKEGPFVWESMQRIRLDYALPSAFRQFIKVAQKGIKMYE